MPSGGLVRFSGPSGEVRHGYRLAAVLGRWTLTNHRLTASLVSAQQVTLSCRPLDVLLSLGSRQFVWRSVAVQVAGSQLAAELPDQPEVLHGTQPLAAARR